MNSAPTVAHGIRHSMPVISRHTARTLALLGAALLLLLIAARIADPLFYASGGVLLAFLALVSYRAPQAVLIAVAFTPIVDRYLVNLLLPARLGEVTTYFSEALLLVVTASVAIRGLREGSVGRAVRNPVIGLLLLFVSLAAISAVLNGVPPLVATGGILFTVDATILFFLPRVVGFTTRQAVVAASVLVGIGLTAAVLALCQAILAPDFLGLESFTGRFAEGNRIAAFLVNPNMLGAVLAMSLPFAVVGGVRLESRRRRAVSIGVSLILTLALFYTFSRGAWLGLGVAMLVVGLLVERRALLLLLAVAAVAFATALVLPREVLLSDAERAKLDIGAATFGRFDSLDGQDLRVLFIRNGAQIIGDHPVLGVGPGRYGGAVAARLGSPLYDEYLAGSVPRDRTVDNFWLHATVEFGVLGALILLSAYAMAVGTLLRAARRVRGIDRGLLAAFAAVAVVLVVDSVTEMLLEGNTTSFSMWLFLGIGSVLAARVTGADGQ